MKLKIEDLHAQIEDMVILNGVDLEIKTGEIHALMGPNGSGKSTLSNVIMGHPFYEVTGGKVFLDGHDLLELDTHERAQLGLFMAFQYPVEIPGVTVGKFMKRAVELAADEQGKMNVTSFLKDLRSEMDFMRIDRQFINRHLNMGFSGGEKKRMEILQMLMMKPNLAILDETDSGLDIDALKIVSRGVNKLRGPEFGALIITHYQRILDHIRPDFVHIMYRGRIVASGGSDLVAKLEEHGYEWVKEKYHIEEEAHEHAGTAG